jgi:hypothetical protein
MNFSETVGGQSGQMAGKRGNLGPASPWYRMGLENFETLTTPTQ